MTTFISTTSAHILSFLAGIFASSPCYGDLYEPKLPKELQEQDE